MLPFAPEPPRRHPVQSLAPYVPTPEDVVARMLRLAGTTKEDIVYDLGCGDGRIPIAAAKTFGARGVGIDIDPEADPGVAGRTPRPPASSIWWSFAWGTRWPPMSRRQRS